MITSDKGFLTINIVILLLLMDYPYLIADDQHEIMFLLELIRKFLGNFLYDYEAGLGDA